MKYVATLNGKKYEIEIERVEQDYKGLLCNAIHCLCDLYIRDVIHGKDVEDEVTDVLKKGKKADKKAKKKLIEDLEKEMKQAAKILDFERAMELRDIIMELKGEK